MAIDDQNRIGWYSLREDIPSNGTLVYNYSYVPHAESMIQKTQEELGVPRNHRVYGSGETNSGYFSNAGFFSSGSPQPVIHPGDTVRDGNERQEIILSTS
jgi:hypothetical protein